MDNQDAFRSMLTNIVEHYNEAYERGLNLGCNIVLDLVAAEFGDDDAVRLARKAAVWINKLADEAHLMIGEAVVNADK